MKECIQIIAVNKVEETVSTSIRGRDFPLPLKRFEA